MLTSGYSDMDDISSRPNQQLILLPLYAENTLTASFVEDFLSLFNGISNFVGYLMLKLV